MSSTLKPINIAILAMGGQGGGVLSDWIVDLAERHGYLAQTTSVPGVAQRTGATIYYVELFPEEAVRQAGREPVLALMPVPGDVDVVIAAELMEAGRAVTRGFVTRERTTLIASTHRDYAIGEKMAMGDGLLDHNKVIEAGEAAAKQFVYFDMAALAEAQHSVISATLFGALAGSGALPFPREAFEEAIRRGGVGVDASSQAFAAAFERAKEKPERPVDPKLAHRAAAAVPAPRHPKVAALIARVQALPEPARFNATEGVRRLIDYQDPAYAALYLDRLEAILALDRQYGGDAKSYALTAETARYLALWMSYEDTIRVADLKTRAARFKRFQSEVDAAPGQLVYVTEFMHPRVEEICDTLPRPLGQWVLDSPRARRLLGRVTEHGRFIRTATLSGFSLLFLLARLRRMRRRTLRYGIEQARIEAWLDRAKALVAEDYALALEVVRLQRLVKGYGDTWERGLRNFEAIMGAVDRARGSEDAATIVRRLREAALADERGAALQKLMAEIDQPRQQPAALA
jgi:indolepyruvate ferredoxin oxidoreductase beta subunit